MHNNKKADTVATTKINIMKTTQDTGAHQIFCHNCNNPYHALTQLHDADADTSAGADAGEYAGVDAGDDAGDSDDKDGDDADGTHLQNYCNLSYN